MTFKGRVMTAFGLMLVAVAIGTVIIDVIDAPDSATQVLTGMVVIPLSMYLAYEIVRERGHLRRRD